MKYAFDLIKSDRKSISLEIRPDGKLTVHAPKNMTFTEINRFVEKKQDWIEATLKKYSIGSGEGDIQPFTEDELKELTAKAKEYIPDRVKFFADKMGITYGKITIRQQKTRWGSCTSDGNLSFNCLLMLMPQGPRDSVIVHELCHRRVMNHSKAFYDEILKVMPDYYENDKWIKKHGCKLMRRLYR